MSRAVFDLDGTLSDFSQRLHLARAAEALAGGSAEQQAAAWDVFHSECEEDKPILPIIQLMRVLYEKGWEIIILTGRHHRYIKETQLWLAEKKVPYHSLVMRGEGDLRPTMSYKIAVMMEHYPGIALIFDDHDRHTAAWRAAGYTCLQTAAGSY